RRRRPSEDQIHLETNEFGREEREPFRLCLTVAELKEDIVSFHIAKFTEAPPEGIEQRRGDGRGGGEQQSYPGYLARRLRRSGKWRTEESEGKNGDDANGATPHDDLLSSLVQPNASLQLLPEAGAQRTLAAVSCKAWFGLECPHPSTPDPIVCLRMSVPPPR